MMKKILLFGVSILFCMVEFYSFSQDNAQNWANFKHYAEQNKLMKATVIVPKRVVFIGNSITEGWVNQHPDFFKQNGYVGRGIGGQTSYQMLLRFREDVINLLPEVVVINAATNDIAENAGAYNEDYSFGNIISMVELARANGIKVILTTTLPSSSFSWNPSIKDATQKITALNKRVATYAKDRQIPFVDYYSNMVCISNGDQLSKYTNDGVHPNSQGYDVMESLIKPVIDKVLN